MKQEVVKTFVPEAVYTDRQEFLDFFYTQALEAAHRRSMSTVLLGQRRMGKTEIFKRVVNRLFFEQDPTDPKAVVPVYFSFPDRPPTDQRVLATLYIENFMRYYFGFYSSRPDIVTGKPTAEDLIRSIESVRSAFPFQSRTFDLILTHYHSIINGGSVVPIDTAFDIPHRIADIDDTTTVMFLDEFQNTRLPQYDLDVVGWFHDSVESPNCPHFVTGSAMGILAREIIGRGSLYGRFESYPIKPFTEYWGAELVLKTARYYQADVTEEMAPVIAERCGGNPFYITAVVRQATRQGYALDTEDVLNRILAVDISSGFIWAELHDQVTSWIERINDYGITKWVLYLSALEEDEEINIERIQQELRERDYQEVSLDTIRQVLVKLSRGDLIDYLQFGNWFRKIDDPILNDFLKVWGKTEVERQNQGRVYQEILERYDKRERKFHEYKGYLAEVFMSQILLNSQKKTLPGHYFHSAEDITMPWPFAFVRQRMRLGSGDGQEIDVIGAAGAEIWVCQSKWVERDPAGIAVLDELLAQAEVVQADMRPRLLRKWLFAYNGLTKDAESYADEHNILWSALPEFNELLRHLGLRNLPEL